MAKIVSHASDSEEETARTRNQTSSNDSQTPIPALNRITDIAGVQQAERSVFDERQEIVRD